MLPWLLLASIVLAGCSAPAGAPVAPPDVGEVPPPAAEADVDSTDEPPAESPEASPARVRVTMRGGSFDPPRLEVAPGTAVEWLNDDRSAHTVTAEDGSFSSAKLDEGQTFVQVFEETGTFAYFCRFHDGMRASVVVVDPAAQEKDGATQSDAEGDGTESASDAREVVVEVRDDAFSPAQIDVRVGDTVTWEHVGARSHTATHERDVFDSGPLRPGDRFSFTFREPGVHEYRCEFHSGMRGVVRVA